MIAIIDYGAGNVASVANALKRLEYSFTITSNRAVIDKAERIIFPGVGEASFAVNRIKENNLFEYLKCVEKPLLGICLGMQLLCSHSDEGDVEGLGVFPVKVVRFNESGTKVPHIGWNTVSYKPGNKLFSGIRQDEFFYFANSFYAPVNGYSTSYSENGTKFTSSLGLKNFYGVQFHPEKSSEAGLLILRNFIEQC